MLNRLLVLGVVWGILPLSAAGAGSAHSQLRSAAVDFEESSPPSAGSGLKAEQCVMRHQFWGTCFSDQKGNMIYWILRNWANGPIGPEIIGYPSVLRQQEQYNHWCLDVLSHPNDFHGILIAMDRAQSGWSATRFQLACPLDELGQLDEWTLRIPYYKAGARTLGLWLEFQEDCAQARDQDGRSVLPSAECRAVIGDFNPELIRGDDIAARIRGLKVCSLGCRQYLPPWRRTIVGPRPWHASMRTGLGRRAPIRSGTS